MFLLMSSVMALSQKCIAKNYPVLPNPSLTNLETMSPSQTSALAVTQPTGLINLPSDDELKRINIPDILNAASPLSLVASLVMLVL